MLWRPRLRSDWPGSQSSAQSRWWLEALLEAGEMGEGTGLGCLELPCRGARPAGTPRESSPLPLVALAEQSLWLRGERRWTGTWTPQISAALSWEGIPSSVTRLGR